jgi:ATP-dependent DNA helicase DinG
MDIKKEALAQNKPDYADIIDSLMEGGVIASRLPFHETRDSQIELTRLIIRAFNEDAIAAAEAGTGVGKSFAYLLPAIAFAEKTGERVLISTATITLQRQLFEKDIPLIIKGLDANVKTALIKGRSNYVCLRRLHSELEETNTVLDFGNNEILKNIAQWVDNSHSGCKSELSFLPPEGLWSRIASDADTCLGTRCPERERCFVMTLKKEAAAAQILVVNHHLLFADLAARDDGAGFNGSAVLPPYKRIIIDEAHNIENAATSFFSGSFNKAGLNLSLGRLLRRNGARKTGMLLKLLAFSGEPDRTEEWLDDMDAIKDAASTLDTAALELCGVGSVFRLIDARDSIFCSRLAPKIIKFRDLINNFTAAINILVLKLEKTARADGDENNDEIVSETEIFLREFKSVMLRVMGVADFCASFLDYKNNRNAVFWVERRISPAKESAAQNLAVFNIAPLDVSAKLKTTLFEKHKTIVCLSATLTVAESFDYWEKHAGISLAKDGAGNIREILSGHFPSPFPYKEEVLTAVTIDAPEPGNSSYSMFINNAVLRLVEAASGSALVLFTSFESLNSAYRFASARLAELGIRCYKQGDDDRSRLLRTFLEDEKSVLFATDSFWEGIDAPGDTLRLVIICKLPFKAPNDPVFEARCEAIERRGGSPFMELSVPEAVIKFRQGFGRLMRRSSDRGVVAVLDSRVVKKLYGELFLRSLPKTKLCIKTLSETVHTVSNFFS